VASTRISIFYGNVRPRRNKAFRYVVEAGAQAVEPTTGIYAVNGVSTRRSFNPVTTVVKGQEI
jgi:hypothetical protein